MATTITGERGARAVIASSHASVLLSCQRRRAFHTSTNSDRSVR